MRMLIVDDEIVAANAICNVFDWRTLDIDEVKVLDSGLDAIEIIKAGGVDILLTDIKMPDLDGLTLSRQSLRVQPELKIILFSGYDDFEYAQKAMRIGVLEYLLKPVTLEEVVPAVRRAVSKCRQERFKRQMEADYIENENKYKDNLVRTVSLKLIQSGEYLKEQEKQEYFRLLQLENIPEKCCAACLKFFEYQQNAIWDIERDSELLRFAVKNVLDELLEGRGISFHTARNNIAILIFNVHSEIECIAKARECLQTINKTLEIGAVIGVGRLASVSKMYESYQDAQKACNVEYFYEKNGVTHADDLKKEEYTYPQELEEKLLKKIALGRQNEESFASILNQYFDAVQGERILTVQTMQNICSTLLMMVFKKLQSLDIDTENIDIIQWMEELKQLHTLRQFRQFMLRKMRIVNDKIARMGISKNKLLVLNAQKYIEEHLDGDLSLETMAKMFFLSSRYFAALFKEYTGVALSDYINNCRMEKAKYLLLNTDQSVGNIARKTGYDDQGHFSRNFKNYTGMKPSEYKKIHK
ncbi:MAG: helix-turn-helix domain-containing protein [Clostridia bacterium]|nr:helix-turn-helix domain-containing protein [Clostridia bacterium]